MCTCTHYRKRGSASYIVREWLLWVVERERDACDVIDITLKSRVIMHMITSTARWPYAYAYASMRSEPAPAVECSKCMTSQNHKQQLLRPRSGSSKIQKHIPEQPGWRNSKYWGNIEKGIKLILKLLEIEKEIVREVVRGDKHNLRKSANCKAQISRMCGVNDTDLCVAICRFSQVVFVPSNNFTHNLLFYFQ